MFELSFYYITASNVKQALIKIFQKNFFCYFQTDLFFALEYSTKNTLFKQKKRQGKQKMFYFQI